ncbi:MAG: hypothetical protein KAS93_01975 [Gammaproteobacteria bacterium]|nr:hypothetical protein [Gammaproteobacteria bacterium]
MLIHITASGQIRTINNDIKITVVDDDKRNRYILSHIPISSKVHRSQRYMKITIDKKDITKQEIVDRCDDSALAAREEEKKLSEYEYNEILLNNLGFAVDHTLFDKVETDPKALLKLGIQAIDNGQKRFATEILRIANKRGWHDIVRQLSASIITTRKRNEPNKQQKQ